MRTKLKATVYPSIIGIVLVLAILLIINLIFDNGSVFKTPDNGFFKLFVPTVTMCAIIIQFSITLRFWEKFKTNKKVFRLNLIQFTSIIILISGILFGLFFWEKSSGINEYFILTFTGIAAFTIYWVSNLLILKLLDKSDK